MPNDEDYRALLRFRTRLRQLRPVEPRRGRGPTG